MMKCADENTKPEELRRPGHVFPLIARDGGVLVRDGHTEATVDLMRLAGLRQCGVCCEIMEDDGTMMRTPNLQKMAQKYNLVFITIKDLQNYIRIHEKHVVAEAVAKMPTKYGEFMIHGYVNDITGEHHVALVKGDIGDGRDVLCRVHSECLTGDVFGSLRCDCGNQLEKAMEQIEREGRGILLSRRKDPDADDYRSDRRRSASGSGKTDGSDAPGVQARKERAGTEPGGLPVRKRLWER